MLVVDRKQVRWLFVLGDEGIEPAFQVQSIIGKHGIQSREIVARWWRVDGNGFDHVPRLLDGGQQVDRELVDITRRLSRRQSRITCFARVFPPFYYDGMQR